MNKFISSLLDAATSWALEHGTQVLFVIILATVARYVLGAVLERLIRRLVSGSSFASKEAEKKREDTLIQITRGTLNVVIWIAAMLMVLSEMGIDIGPLLTAAGVAGLAIGFGGQYLIRDVVAGEFRKLIKIAFDKSGIVIPFPHRDFHQK